MPVSVSFPAGDQRRVGKDPVQKCLRRPSRAPVMGRFQNIDMNLPVSQVSQQICLPPVFQIPCQDCSEIPVCELKDHGILVGVLIRGVLRRVYALQNEFSICESHSPVQIADRNSFSVADLLDLQIGFALSLL